MVLLLLMFFCVCQVALTRIHQSTRIKHNILINVITHIRDFVLNYKAYRQTDDIIIFLEFISLLAIFGDASFLFSYISIFLLKRKKNTS